MFGPGIYTSSCALKAGVYYKQHKPNPYYRFLIMSNVVVGNTKVRMFPDPSPSRPGFHSVAGVCTYPPPFRY
ncbi:hypothetical protein Hypma_001708 [Hypsizygus marmoreus]|uniref:PARP catalytic domain-containing protein n=1 Tax=Hypsizygus marmoreus TaxID=39966 RepID=A0A369J9G6_HYPMA|nr:hypothetical protein Hypma_001708 [Hypsizygus marmoreus]